eukprot:scaffold18639_cov57-Phaeocystis_antarctica.AAC.6
MENTLILGCAQSCRIRPIHPNSTQFDQFKAVGARFDPGTGANGSTVSSQWLYGLPQPRPHLWHYFFRHRDQLAPIGAAAPFPDLMVSRNPHDDLRLCWR